MRLRGRIGESVSSQRGFALIALLALAALISAFLIASTLNFTSAGTSKEREDRSMSALRQAKAALIAYAANEQWQLYKSLPDVPPVAYFQPGALPCPDKDDDGDADCTGSNTASMIGRLPFKTMGIDDLRDASGERLWYALSHDFRKMQCSSPNSPSGCTMINSDTLGQLTVTGTAPATQVVAIVFAPGEAIQGQNRDPTNALAHNNPANYLENFVPGDGVHFTFTTTALPSGTFNDRLLVITQADLMAAVEPVVAAGIQRDIAPLVQAYFTKWGAYPFAASFDVTGGGGPGREPQAIPDPILDRLQSAYKGTSSALTSGLLPLSSDPNWFRWTSATVTTVQKAGTGIYAGAATISPDPTSCTIGTSPSQATCQVTYSGSDSDDRPVIKVDIFLANWDMAFAGSPSPTDSPSLFTAAVNLTMTPNPGGTIQNDKYGPWSFVSPDFPPTRTFVPQVTGHNAVLTYIGRLQPATATNNGVFITIPLPAPSYLAVTSSDLAVNPSGAWFIRNQWYRQTYYAVSPGFVPGAGAACNPPNPPFPCLTVRNLPAPTNNKAAILVFAGRALNGSTRPSADPANYLEGENSTPADLVFEHRAGTPTAINDRVVVVSP